MNRLVREPILGCCDVICGLTQVKLADWSPVLLDRSTGKLLHIPQFNFVGF